MTLGVATRRTGVLGQRERGRELSQRLSVGMTGYPLSLAAVPGGGGSRAGMPNPSPIVAANALATPAATRRAAPRRSDGPARPHRRRVPRHVPRRHEGSRFLGAVAGLGIAISACSSGQSPRSVASLPSHSTHAAAGQSQAQLSQRPVRCPLRARRWRSRWSTRSGPDSSRCSRPGRPHRPCGRTRGPEVAASARRTTSAAVAASCLFLSGTLD
jgi:hypothetical protein